MSNVAAVQTQTYNGWSNRETWLASLWLTNDEDSFDILGFALQTDGELYDKAEFLERIVQERFNDQYPIASLWCDLIGTALGRINWYEIIENNQ